MRREGSSPFGRCISASARDPLDARPREAIAVGVTTRKCRLALDPLPGARYERAVANL